MTMGFVPGCVRIEGTPNEPRRLRAATGPYRLEMVLNTDPGNNALGVVYFALGEGRPVWDTSFLPTLDEPAPELVNVYAIALGPIYREADGSWIPLAGIPATWYDTWLEVEGESGETLSWSVTWKIYGGPTIQESFSLAPTGLEYVCQLQWTIPGFRVQMPVPLSHFWSVPQIRGPRLSLSGNGRTVVAESHSAESFWTLQSVASQVRTPCYVRAILQSSQAVEYRLTLKVLFC